MAVVAGKRSVMTLYSGSSDPYSHRTRMVLAEKGVTFDLLEIDVNRHVDELAEINPYSTVPTLVDRDLVLYESQIIMEYLDERFPHPPLMPVYPVARARSRLMMHRIDRDWYASMRTIQESEGKEKEEAQKNLRDSITSIEPLFAEMPFFLSEEFSLVDCSLAALFWRLPTLGVELPKSCKAIRAYEERIYERDSFRASLTKVELGLRD